MKGLIYTYTLTAIGAVVPLFYPLVGLFIFINFALVRPHFMWYWSVPAQRYSLIVGTAMLIGWMFRGFGDWRLGRSALIFSVFGGFVVWNGLSAVMAASPSLAAGSVVDLIKLLLPFAVGLTMIDSIGKLKGLAWCLALSQGYVAFELNLAFFSGFNRVHAVGFGGMDNNFAAVGMAVGAGLAFFMGLNEKRIWLKGLAFLAAALMAHTIMFSFSRGGMLGLIVLGAVSFALIPKKPIHLLFFLIAVGVAFRMAGPDVRDRFATVFVDKEERDYSSQSRIDLWKACYDEMKSKPLLGCGPRHWQEIAHTHGFRRGKSAHSIWFETGAETGFPGVGFLILFYAISVFRLFPLTFERTPVIDPFIRDVARMSIAGIVGFCVAASFVSIAPLEIPYFTVLLGAVALKLNGQGAKAAAIPVWRPMAGRRVAQAS